MVAPGPGTTGEALAALLGRSQRHVAGWRGAADLGAGRVGREVTVVAGVGALAGGLPRAVGRTRHHYGGGWGHRAQ
jgi:hypothetical protein